MKDYYYVLGIDTAATEGQIKTAYRKLALKFHPDKNQGDKLYEERFKIIQEAYEILINSEKRFEYDVKFNTSRSQKKDNKQEQEIIKRYGEELRKKDEENQQKYKTAAQKAAEEQEIKRKEEEVTRKAELQKLLVELENYKDIQDQKEKVISDLRAEMMKAEEDLPQLKTIIDDLNFKIDYLKNFDNRAHSKTEQYTRTGELFGGGIIIYTNETGDHGLVCSAEDVGKCVRAEAQTICDEYNAGTYTDWRLPTKEELLLIYQLLYKKMGVKNFTAKNYWSSTINKDDFAWIFDFHSGDAYDYYNKYNAYFVRAVRAF